MKVTDKITKFVLVQFVAQQVFFNEKVKQLVELAPEKDIEL